MAKKKNSYLNLFGKEKASISKTESERAKQNAMDKKTIEQFKMQIQQKLKDPALAKKAAQIIEDMLKDPGGTKVPPKGKKSKKSA